MKKKKEWQCSLLMESGEIIRALYHADNEEMAEEIAQKTAEIFGMEIIKVCPIKRLESKI